MDAMFQKHLLADAQLIYGEFINELTKVMVSACDLSIFSNVISILQLGMGLQSYFNL